MQVDCHAFKASLDYQILSHFKNKTSKQTNKKKT